MKNPGFAIPFPCYHHVWSGSVQEMLNLEKIQVRMDDFNKASVAHAAPVTCAEPAAVAADIVASSAAAAIAAVPEASEPAAATETKEQQIHNLCTEWRGTIRSLWQNKQQVFKAPDGSWKLLHDQLRTTLAWKTERKVLSGHSRRNPSPMHLLAVLNANQFDKEVTAIDLAKLIEPIKDGDRKLVGRNGLSER